MSEVEITEVLTKLVNEQGKTNRMLTLLFGIIAVTCILFIAACMVTPSDEITTNSQVIVCTQEQLDKILEGVEYGSN